MFEWGLLVFISPFMSSDNEDTHIQNSACHIDRCDGLIHGYICLHPKWKGVKMLPEK